MAFTIGILETGKLPEVLRDQHGAYGDMFERLVGGVDPSFAYRVYAVVDGQFPESVNDCDGWLITGSRHGVYERLPWMAPLEEFLRKAVAAEVPVVGVCFGHQILATALGGQVEKSLRGWGVGPTTYELADHKPWMGEEQETFTLNAMHQDQVVTLPPSAKVFASSEFCPYAGISYHDRAISFQAHPEFSNDFEKSLIMARADVLPQDRVKPALQALSATDSDLRMDSERVGRWIAMFFRQTIKKAGASDS